MIVHDAFFLKKNLGTPFRVSRMPTTTSTIKTSLRTIQRFANRSRRWIDSYIARLNDKQKEFVVDIAESSL